MSWLLCLWLGSDSKIQVSLKADLILVPIHSAFGTLHKNICQRGPFGSETQIHAAGRPVYPGAKGRFPSCSVVCLPNPAPRGCHYAQRAQFPNWSTQRKCLFLNGLPRRLFLICPEAPTSSSAVRRQSNVWRKKHRIISSGQVRVMLLFF